LRILAWQQQQVQIVPDDIQRYNNNHALDSEGLRLYFQRLGLTEPN
jgi:hypothetical protein